MYNNTIQLFNAIVVFLILSITSLPLLAQTPYDSYSSKVLAKAYKSFHRKDYDVSINICKEMTRSTMLNAQEKEEFDYLLILNYGAKSQLDEAEEKIHGFIASYPQSDNISNIYYKLATIYLSKHLFADAEKIYNMLIQQFPDDSGKAQHLLGALLFYEGRITEATDVLENAINKHPIDSEMPTSIMLLARIVAHKGQHNRSVQLFKRLIEEYPNSDRSIEAQHLIGFQYEYLNDYMNAITNYTIAINKYPDSKASEMTLSNLAKLYMRRKEYSKAINVYQQLMARYPNSQFIGELKHNLGFLYYKEGNIERARAMFQEATKEYADNVLNDRTLYYLRIINGDQ